MRIHPSIHLAAGLLFVMLTLPMEVAAKPVSSAFESTLVKIAAKPSNESVDVQWAYTNGWDFPLVVERFETYCNCLSGHEQLHVQNLFKNGKPIMKTWFDNEEQKMKENKV